MPRKKHHSSSSQKLSTYSSAEPASKKNISTCKQTTVARPFKWRATRTTKPWRTKRKKETPPPREKSLRFLPPPPSPPSSRCRCATSRKPSSTPVVVEGRKIVRAVSSCLSLRRVSLRARITVDNGPKGSRGRVSEEERGVVKIETLEPRSALESCSPRFFTPAVDDFLALPPRNGPPGLRFFAYYRREGRRLRGLGLPLLTGWMKGWMKEGEKRFGRYPARADRRPRWPLSPLPPRADFGSTGGIGFLATSVVEGSRDDSIVSGCKLNFSVSLVVGPSLPISRVLELTLFFFSFHFSNAWNPFFHR